MDSEKLSWKIQTILLLYIFYFLLYTFYFTFFTFYFTFFTFYFRSTQLSYGLPLQPQNVCRRHAHHVRLHGLMQSRQ